MWAPVHERLLQRNILLAHSMEDDLTKKNEEEDASEPEARANTFCATLRQ